jgi:hypothetical protein
MLSKRTRPYSEILSNFWKPNKEKKKKEKILVSNKKPLKYEESKSWQEIVLSLSWGHLYDGIVGTSCKPWDDRELDIIDGFKAIYFWMTIVCMCVFMLFQTNIPDIL